MVTLNINGHDHSVDVPNDTPLLWVIREHLQMTGTKFGCGAGLCGACTVHLNGEAVRSCQTAVSQAAGKKITTIEGLDPKGEHPLQRAWIAEQVPQCGYCQSGQIMQAASLSGGFGRRLESDMTVPAVAAAKAVGKPVKLIYAREDDMQMDFTRPLTYQKVKVGLDAEGHAVAMEHDVIGAWPTARWGIPAFLTPAVDKKGPHDSFTVNGADYWYTIPNHTVRNFENKLAQNATPSGQLRSVAPGWTFWAVESTMDDIAHATGQDPVEMRLKLLDGAGANAGGDKPQNIGGAKHLANVLRIAVGRAGYGALKLGENEGIGVACVSSQERTSPTWTACVAHVKVDPKSGDVTLKKLTLAMDVGTVVNPDGVRAQIEGSTLWGASIAMLEKATMENGGIQQTNFDGYTPMRLSQVPELDISIVGNGEPAVGCGEPAVTVVAPAIGNAIFNAVGARVRSLPITAEAVKAAMKS